MTLEQFIIAEKETLEKFRVWYTSEHNNNPEQFPLEFPEENSGMWFEQNMMFSVGYLSLKKG